ncbi:MAG TPA: hypothetical protein DCR93_33485 [Cytophagales bacterium]|nr:hypothetical protein [Cytophagales bacterium]HAP64191.1 hypothetical protein [Cytophagales bacterium]
MESRCVRKKARKYLAVPLFSVHADYFWLKFVCCFWEIGNVKKKGKCKQFWGSRTKEPKSKKPT